jgi:hypothetical protein
MFECCRSPGRSQVGEPGPRVNHHPPITAASASPAATPMAGAFQLELGPLEREGAGELELAPSPAARADASAGFGSAEGLGPFGGAALTISKPTIFGRPFAGTSYTTRRTLPSLACVNSFPVLRTGALTALAPAPTAASVFASAPGNALGSVRTVAATSALPLLRGFRIRRETLFPIREPPGRLRDKPRAESSRVAGRHRLGFVQLPRPQS